MLNFRQKHIRTETEIKNSYYKKKIMKRDTIVYIKSDEKRYKVIA